MKTLTLLRIAYRNLMEHKLRSLLTILGVTIGIAAIIFLVSFGYGLEQLVTNKVVDFNEYTIINVTANSNKAMPLNDDIAKRLSALAHVQTVAPVISLAGRLKQSDSQSSAETIITAGNTNYWRTAEIKADQGAMPQKDNEIVINQNAAKLINLTPSQAIGQTVNLDLILPADLQKDSQAGIKVLTNTKLKIVGVIINTQNPTVFVSIDLLKENGIDKFSAFKIKIDRQDSAATLRKQIENLGLNTTYVGDTISEITQVFTFFKIILAAFGLITLVVAALGTFNTLTISLLERIREVGLLKALGMRNRDIYKLFLTESLIIVITGGAFGIFLGWGLGQGINGFLMMMAVRVHAQPVGLFMTPWFVVAAMGVFSLLVGFLIGWYPARRAVKIDPLDALRYE
jgi:ABC-type antimicrobial peptide transport system permease subunit